MHMSNGTSTSGLNWDETFFARSVSGRLSPSAHQSPLRHEYHSEESLFEIQVSEPCEIIIISGRQSQGPKLYWSTSDHDPRSFLLGKVLRLLEELDDNTQTDKPAKNRVTNETHCRD
ncbi:hypothetical protein NQ317_013976 [Molorchus minor]|uniref:Uncharacterized protein n=1 Tax=Molorchus minor TaxID=1323400 RepID=A0ABQ9IW24_9CUCU|nr:hypothetical protein NQ317_013976 [Molorchus minor]